MNKKDMRIANISYLTMPILLMFSAIIPLPFFNKVLHLYQPILFLFAIYVFIFDFSYFKTLQLNFFSAFCIVAFLLLFMIVFYLIRNNLLFSLQALGEPAVVLEALLLSFLGYIIISKIKQDSHTPFLLKAYVTVYYSIILINLAFQLIGLFYNPTLLVGISYTAHKIFPGIAGRYSGLFPYPANAGLVIGVFLLQLIYYYFKNQVKTFTKLTLFIMFLTTIFSGLLTGSKGFVYFLSLCLVYSIAYFIYRRRNILFQLCTAILLSIAIISILPRFNFPSHWAKVTKRTIQKKNIGLILTGNRLKIGSSSMNWGTHRYNAGVLSKIYTEHLKTHWLFGIGPEKIKGYESDTIFIFAFGGVFILLAFYLVLIYFFYQFCKQRKIFMAMLFSLYGAASFLIPVFFSNTIQVFVFESLIFYFLNEKITNTHSTAQSVKLKQSSL